MAGRRVLQRVGPGPREQREKREEGSGVRGVCGSSSGFRTGREDGGQGLGWGRRGCLALNQQVFRGRGHVWTPKWNCCPSSWTGVYWVGDPLLSAHIREKGSYSSWSSLSLPGPRAHPSSSPREPQKPPSDLPFPCSHSSPRPSASPASFQGFPPSPSPASSPSFSPDPGGLQRQDGPAAGETTSAQNTTSRAWVFARPESWAFLEEARPEQALWLPGAYLYAIVLLVSSTLPSYGGEKVEGYQHQAGHQGPEGKEEQHPRAAGGQGAGSAIWETSSCFSSLLWSLGLPVAHSVGLGSHSSQRSQV